MSKARASLARLFMRFTLLLVVLMALFLQVTPSTFSAKAEEPYGTQALNRASYLGIGLVDVDSARAHALHMDTPRGAEVTRVDDGSPAEKAGLRTGDVLLAYNGENILGGQQLARLVLETPPGRRVTVLYWRSGKEQTGTVLTAVRPRTLEAPADGWTVGTADGRIYNPAEIPFPLLIWRNLMLGIECEALQPPLADYFGVTRGVLVRSVQRGSMADSAGLRAGDAIVAVAEHPITSPRELTAIIRAGWVPGRAMRLQFFRDHKRLATDLTVPEDAQ